MRGSKFCIANIDGFMGSFHPTNSLDISFKSHLFLAYSQPWMYFSNMISEHLNYTGKFQLCVGKFVKFIIYQYKLKPQPSHDIWKCLPPFQNRNPCYNLTYSALIIFILVTKWRSRPWLPLNVFGYDLLLM